MLIPQHMRIDLFYYGVSIAIVGISDSAQSRWPAQRADTKCVLQVWRQDLMSTAPYASVRLPLSRAGPVSLS